MSIRIATLATLLTALTMSVALLWAAQPAVAGPGLERTAAAEEELEDELEPWPEDECELLEPLEEECEPVGEEEVEGQVPQEECLLRSTTARVLAWRSRDRLRLVVRYSTLQPTRAYVDLRFSSPRGTQSLGVVRRRLSLRGTLRLDERLPERRMEQARQARQYIVTLDLPEAPAHCRRLLTTRLSHKRTVQGQAVWTQAGPRRGG